MSLVDVVADLCSDEPAANPRWWLALIEEMPPDGAFVAAQLGGQEFRGWDMDRYLLASIFDAIQVGTVSNARVQGAKGMKTPQPWPRPGAKKRAPQGAMTMAQLMKSGAYKQQGKAPIGSRQPGRH